MSEQDARVTIAKEALLQGCRHNLNERGLIRFWELGSSPLVPHWFDLEKVDMFCDAELYFRDRNEKPTESLSLRFCGISTKNSFHEVIVTFERSELFSANYQLAEVEFDGRMVDVVEHEEEEEIDVDYDYEYE